ncbi:MAG: 30S ribosomal protein S12 methylthiotransferase RimO [Clostridiales Family XIII bacterium]|jgi:ribosomal protein S12 methylthiotransferase|nr:30S ribosomal protein S12 methylthiotransferase RimO [Clostridiales Family XIII bacterium]
MNDIRVYIDTVGCYKNVEDSERAAGLLEAAGYSIAVSPDMADVILVNTCGFIEDAKRESIERILELTGHKDRGAKLVISGCLSQRYPGEIFDEIPEADAVIGVNEYGSLPEIIDGILGGAVVGSATPRIMKADSEPAVLTGERKLLSPGATAFLKVAEGCDNRCSYCAIPMIRGPYRSVPMESLVIEAGSLIRTGVREIVLIAQDVSAYGFDIYGCYALPELLKMLVDDDTSVPDWIRLMYCYEERVTDELIEAIACHDSVCKYIDIPLQHISDSVLAQMGRRSTRQSIEGTITKLRAAVPGIAIRTTFMTGFPGETEDDFAELMDFVNEYRFERLGVFAYSPEDGTVSAGMPSQVPREIAEERRDALMLTQTGISLEANRSFIGRALTVLVEDREDASTFVGRTEYDAPEIDGSVIFSAPPDTSLGTFVKVIITDAMDYDLVGETV